MRTVLIARSLQANANIPNLYIYIFESCLFFVIALSPSSEYQFVSFSPSFLPEFAFGRFYRLCRGKIVNPIKHRIESQAIPYEVRCIRERMWQPIEYFMQMTIRCTATCFYYRFAWSTNSIVEKDKRKRNKKSSRLNKLLKRICVDLFDAGKCVCMREHARLWRVSTLNIGVYSLCEKNCGSIA